MINNTNNIQDVGFIHDVGGLDKLRQQAVDESSDGQSKALRAAAEQFEGIFTQMLFKSMRDANSAFNSDLMTSQNQKFFEQMRDDQMASELSSSGSLGLADMIVAQLGGQAAAQEEVSTRRIMRNAAMDSSLRLPVERDIAQKAADDAMQVMAAGGTAAASRSQSRSFNSPEDFVTSMKPYAEKAGRALGVEPAILLAQAALETGWGKKVVKNAFGTSNNLFNIKADRRWEGGKVATQTLEFHNGIPVQETAAFRSYDDYQASFNDYVSFLHNNPRYEKALQNTSNPESFIRGIHSAGYATDPKYSEKVLQVMGRVNQILE